MQLVFNPSGTHEHKGQLKSRWDLIPEKGEKSYDQNVNGFSGTVTAVYHKRYG